MESLEEVMRQQRVLRDRALERRGERIHVVEPFAREDSFVEEVLIRVRHRRRVGVDARVPRIEPREQRAGSAHERHADARLENAVSVGDAADARVERGAIERVSHHADQLTSHASRKPGIAVERDAVLDLRQDAQVADRHGKARIGGAAQQPVELLDLPALALPSHPEPFTLVPLAQTVEQEEPVGAAVGVPGVERGDRRTRRLEDLFVVRQCFCMCVREVAEDGEVDVRVDVAERLHFEVRHQIADALHAVEERRHDHHRLCRRRHGLELEPRQPARWNQVADQPLQNLDGQFACGDHRQERDEDQRGAAPAVRPRVEHSHGHKESRARGDGSEVPGVANAKNIRRTRCVRSGCHATLRSNCLRPAPIRW